MIPSPNHTAAPDLAETTAVILAGGLGTRLRSVVADRPKVLAEIHGRPFLAYLLDQLGDSGIREVALCTGYQAEAIALQFGVSYRNVALTYSQETEPLGTGGAVRQALPRLHSDPVLVLNGDSYCGADLGVFLDAHRRSGAEASLLLAEVDDSSRYGRVEVDSTGAVRGFAEKAPASGAGWINAGVYLLSQAFLRALPRSVPLSLEREVFPAWVGRRLTGHRGSGWFIDIGTPESYAQAGQLFAGREAK
ncbi:MAG: nucleotidyltransferase family protein [Gemmataceae bacterium]|nr:nucleotidyltransferase family protein [Gemmataceae bacterium]